MTVQQVISPEYYKDNFENEKNILIKHRKLHIESAWRGKEGNEILGEVIINAQHNQKGEYKGNNGVFRDITLRKKAEEILKKRETELETKTKSLEEMNTALRVLLKKRDEDRFEIEEKILANIKELVEPYLIRLRKNCQGRNQIALIDIIESNIQDIASSFLNKLSGRFINLSPAEMQVASLVKHGKSSKEIAEFLNLSRKTIDSHRDSIRKKLGIKNKKANLRTHLATFK